MTYAVHLSPAARRALRHLHPQARRRVLTALDVLADQPRPPAAEPLTGRPAWRVRVGDYRIIHEIHDNRLLIAVIDLGHRREIYRER